jgi:cell division protein FtsN
MIMNKAAVGLCIALLLGIGGCSRQQSDWEKTRAANTTDSYEQFLKKYPSGEFTAQAQARVKELYEERDWQKARDTDTQEAYQAFLKQYPEGKWTEEARIRVENFTLAQAPSNATPAGSDTANTPATPASSANSTPGATPSPGATPAVRTPPAAPPPSSATTPARTAAPPVKTAAAGGSYGIQLGAFRSSAAANRRWTRLNEKYAQLLAGLSSTVTPTKRASGTLYRLQATGLSETHARAICKSLQAKAQPCVVVHPGAH